MKKNLNHRLMGTAVHHLPLVPTDPIFSNDGDVGDDEQVSDTDRYFPPNDTDHSEPDNGPQPSHQLPDQPQRRIRAPPQPKSDDDPDPDNSDTPEYDPDEEGWSRNNRSVKQQPFLGPQPRGPTHDEDIQSPLDFFLSFFPVILFTNC